MPDTAGLSEARRALIEKYLRGDLPGGQPQGPPHPNPTTPVPTRADIDTQHAKAERSFASLRMTGPNNVIPSTCSINRIPVPQTGCSTSGLPINRTPTIRERVVEIQVGGSKRPFFFLHGNWKGTPYFCFSLARELGSDQPFYALEPYQFDGLPLPPTVETMAAAHLLSLRAVQPEGPYLLGGFCNGGLVAYEMARQLHAAGQTVDLLVLMDAMYLGYRTRRRLIRGVISHLGDLIGLGPDKQLDCFLLLLHVGTPLHYMTHALLHVYRRLRNMRHGSSQDSVRLIISDVISFARQEVMTNIKRFAPIPSLRSRAGFEHGRVAPPRLTAPTDETLRQDYLGIFEWIDMGYRPSGLYPGKITFFWPSKEPWHTVSGGWRKVAEAKEAREVEVHIIPGNQHTWRTDHLHALAERLRMCLSKAQKEVT